MFCFICLCSKIKTNTWHGTVAGVLSVGNKQLFKSGAVEFNETGWWSLIENRPPSLKPEPSMKGKKASCPLVILFPLLSFLAFLNYNSMYAHLTSAFSIDQSGFMNVISLRSPYLRGFQEHDKR